MQRDPELYFVHRVCRKLHDECTVKVMSEIGIDISGQRSKRAEEFRDFLFDIVVTVCDRAKTICPICGTTMQPIPDAPIAKTIIHKSFIDPAAAIGSESEKLSIIRQVRDEIRDWITSDIWKFERLKDSMRSLRYSSSCSLLKRPQHIDLRHPLE